MIAVMGTTAVVAWIILLFGSARKPKNEKLREWVPGVNDPPKTVL